MPKIIGQISGSFQAFYPIFFDPKNSNSIFIYNCKSTQPIKKTITLPALCLLTLGLFAQMEETLTLETETGAIYGILLLPAATGQVPVVSIIARSGPTNRNGNNPMMTNNSLKMLAEGLQSNDMAAVHYDKRGIGESKDAAHHKSASRFEHYVADAPAWIERLSGDARFSKIIVLGHSEDKAGSLQRKVPAPPFTR